MYFNCFDQVIGLLFVSSTNLHVPDVVLEPDDKVLVPFSLMGDQDDKLCGGSR